MDRQTRSEVPVPQPFSRFRVRRSKTHGTRKERDAKTMNPRKIEPLYKELSKHFAVPMAQWKILPKPKISKKQIEQFISENCELPLGKFLAKMEELPLGIVVTSMEEEDSIDPEKKKRTIVRKLSLNREIGRFVKEPIARIVFLGTPTLKTVMHEFMHYLTYCAREEMQKK